MITEFTYKTVYDAWRDHWIYLQILRGVCMTDAGNAVKKWEDLNLDERSAWQIVVQQVKESLTGYLQQKLAETELSTQGAYGEVARLKNKVLDLREEIRNLKKRLKVRAPKEVPTIEPWMAARSYQTDAMRPVPEAQMVFESDEQKSIVKSIIGVGPVEIPVGPGTFAVVKKKK